MQTVLQTERLTLRPLALSDADTVHVYASDPELTRYMLYLPNETREETLAFLSQAAEEWQKQAPAFFEFAIVLEGVQIGAVSIYLNEDRTKGELGWILNRDYHGKGYAAEAARACVRYAFDVLGAEEVCAIIRDTNLPSQGEALRCGMTKTDSWVKHYRGVDMPHTRYVAVRG